MSGYLLDNSALSHYYNPRQPKHLAARLLIDALPGASTFISVVTLAEMEFGCRAFEVVEGAPAVDFRRSLSDARQRGNLLRVSEHTAGEYARLKVAVGCRYLRSLYRKGRPRFFEDWADQVTGMKLGVDENDLWICAQALERDLCVVASDKLEVIRRADPQLKLQVL